MTFVPRVSTNTVNIKVTTRADCSLVYLTIDNNSIFRQIESQNKLAVTLTKQMHHRLWKCVCVNLLPSAVRYLGSSPQYISTTYQTVDFDIYLEKYPFAVLLYSSMYHECLWCTCSPNATTKCTSRSSVFSDFFQKISKLLRSASCKPHLIQGVRVFRAGESYLHGGTQSPRSP